MSLLTAANPDNSEIQLKSFPADERWRGRGEAVERGVGRKRRKGKRQLVLLIRLAAQVHMQAHMHMHTHTHMHTYDSNISLKNKVGHV